MREIKAQQITEVVSRLCVEANNHLPGDMKARIEACHAQETWPQAKEILERIMENYNIADDKNQPICQDTGVACVFLKIGQEVHIDGDITEAVDWYASVGADGMFPLERNAGVDVSLYIDKQPDLAFIGHFDKMCMKYGKEAMRAEFERILPSMQRGKVIVSVDHQTPPDVSIDTYKDYVKLLFEYCEKATHKDVAITPCPVFQSKDK